MAKLSTDFILIDESVVMNGFRAVMLGAQLDAFKKNPVMLFMHNRATQFMSANDDDVILPIGKWYDIRVEGSQLLAKPDFDDNDDFALKIQGKVEGGYLNAASIWLDPIATSDDVALAIAGQRGPTITEWGVLECSIVDIPNCKNALAIRNSAGKKIALEAGNDNEIIDYLKTLLPDKKNNMDKKLLCAKLGLNEEATDVQISEKLVALQTNVNAHTQLSAENTTLKDEVIRLKKEADDKKITDLVDGAVTAGKLVAGDRDSFVKLATADFATTSALIGNMKAYESIEGKLKAGGTSEGDKIELDALMKLSGKELYMAGKLERLQALSVEHFKLKYKEAFGCEFKVVKPSSN